MKLHFGVSGLMFGMCLATALLITACEKQTGPVHPTSPQSSITLSTPPGSDKDWNDRLNTVRDAPMRKMTATCPEDRYCGPMDVAFVIDNTGSMGGAINNVKTELNSILDCIDAVSDGDYRLSLVTFKDNITIHNNFAAANKAAVSASILALTAGGGGGEPEASDEALNTVVNALAAGGRPQNIDFTPDWRAAAKKIVILVTDARPAGFDDSYTGGVDNVNAATRATQAAGRGILISAIYTETSTTNSATIIPIMQNYATTTGGVYIKTPSDGSGTGDAMIQIISTCGAAEIPVNIDIKPGSCPNPFNVNQNGVVPIAILGSGSLNVTQIDLSTIKLAGVAPQNWSALDDVATPYNASLDDCYSCNTTGADGHVDLKLKFDAPTLAAALAGANNGDCMVLELTGNLLPAYGGTPIRGSDIVKIIKNN